MGLRMRLCKRRCLSTDARSLAGRSGTRRSRGSGARNNGAHRLLADERGAATTEGVIVSMFLILCFALALFVYKRSAVVLRNTATVRQALWAKVVPGSDEGDLDGQLAGAYPTYEARMRALAPVFEPYHDTVRVDVQREERDDAFVTSPYMGARELRFRAELSTVANETPETPEDDLVLGTVDTWCRVSEVCDPSQAFGFISGGL